MAERPEPLRDLDWDPARARAFTDGVADIYEELLTRLRDLPVSGTWGVGEVRDAVAIPIPDDPMPEEELLEYLRTITFDYSGFLGHPRFYAYISGAGTVPGLVVMVVPVSPPKSRQYSHPSSSAAAGGAVDEPGGESEEECSPDGGDDRDHVAVDEVAVRVDVGVLGPEGAAE